MSVAVENLLITKLIKYLNKNMNEIGLPCKVWNNEHPAKGEALWVQPNGGQREFRWYVGGSYGGRFPFTLCYQMTGAENVEGRRACLDIPAYSLGKWCDEHKTIQLDESTTVTMEMQTHPALSYVSDDGQTVQHDAVFVIEYRGKKTYFEGE